MVLPYPSYDVWDVGNGENTGKLPGEISIVIGRSHDVVVLVQLGAFEIDTSTQSTGEQIVGISRGAGRQFTAANRVAATGRVMASLAASGCSTDICVLSQENLAGRASLPTTFGLVIPIATNEGHV
jgi:hypothetical protein